MRYTWTKFPENNTTENDNAAFKDAMNVAMEDLKKEYISELQSSASIYSNGLTKDNDHQKTINAAVKRGEEEIASYITRNQVALDKFFKNSKTKKLAYVHSKIGAFCKRAEHAMRSAVARADFKNAKTMNQSTKYNIGKYINMVKPEVADEKITAAVNGLNSPTVVPQDLFRAGYDAISEMFTQQMTDFSGMITEAVTKLENTVGEPSTRTKIVQDDLDDVKLANSRIVKLVKEMETTMEKMDYGLMAYKEAEDIIYHIGVLYNDILDHLNKEGRHFFSLIVLAEYDFLHKSEWYIDTYCKLNY